MPTLGVINFWLVLLLSLLVPAISDECSIGYTKFQTNPQLSSADDVTTIVESQSSFVCYKLFRNPVTWAVANDTCAKENGFLPMMTNNFESLIPDRNVTKLYWVGLTKVFREWQWISWPPQVFETPVFPEVNAYWGLQFANVSTPMIGDCAYLDVTDGKLRATGCTLADIKLNSVSVLPHYCMNYGINVEDPNLEQGTDFDVILESSDKLIINASKGDRFPTLQCRVSLYNQMYSYIGKTYFDVVLVKNGIYLPDERSFSLDLNYVSWDGNRRFKAGSELQLNTLNRNGIYWCEVSRKGQRPWYMSNKLNVSYADYDVLAITVKGRPTDEADTIKDAAFQNVLDFIFNSTAEYSAVSSSIRNRNQFDAYLYFETRLNRNFYDSIENAKQQIATLAVILDTNLNEMTVTDVFLTPYYFCPNYTDNANGGLAYWEQTMGGDVAVSSPPCFFKDDSIFVRKCNFHFQDGSRWEDYPPNVVCHYDTVEFRVILDDARFSNYESTLKGKCEEDFVSVISGGNNQYRNYCVSKSMQNPQTYLKALEFCRSRNADLPGPIILEKRLWVDHFKNFEDKSTWTTLSYHDGKFQWNTLFESEFINNYVTLDGVPDYSQEFCAVADVTTKVKIQPKSCNERFPYFCVKMVDALSSTSECPNGWMSNVDGNEDSPCWNGKIVKQDNESLHTACQEIGAEVKRDITSILPGSQLLKASKKLYSNSECSISNPPFGHITLAVSRCEFVENEEIAICQKSRRNKRPARVVVRLLDIDPKKLECKGYNIISAFGVRWYYNNIILYDVTAAKIYDRGLESIIEPKIHQQGYYKCEMWYGDPLTSVISSEILFQFPNISNDVSPNVKNDIRCIEAINIFQQPNRIDKMHVSSNNDNVTRSWRAFTTSGNNLPFCNILTSRVDETGLALGNASMCPAEQGGFTRSWPATRSGSIAVPTGICLFSNGEPMIRRCLGDFQRGAFWEKDTFPQCEGQRRPETIELKRLSETTIHEDNINKVAINLTTLTQNTSNIENIDLHYIASTLENLAASKFLKRKHVKEAFQTLENVLVVDDDTLTRAQSQMSTSVRIISALAGVVQSSSTGEDSKINFTTPNAAILKTKIYKRGYAYTPAQNDSKILFNSEIVNFDPVEEFEDVDIINSEAIVVLPSDVQVYNSDAPKSVASLIVYKNSKLFFSTAIANASLRNVTNYVVSISVEGQSDTRWFNDPLQIYLEKSNDIATDKLKCVFLDTQVSMNTQWSQLGCVYNGTKHNKIVCLCDHMTDFSAMMELDGHDISAIHKTILKVITYTGIACSVLGLLFIIVTYICHRKWRTGNMHHTVFNFAIALCIALIEYLLIDKLYRWELPCVALAASMHYFLLACFCWMTVEGLLQYLRFVKVIGTYIPRFMLKVAIFAWGVPLIPVVILLGLDHECYINEEEKRCWMKGDQLLYWFIIPLGLCLFVNVVIFCCVVHNLAKCSQTVARASYSSDKQRNSSSCFPAMSRLDWRRFMALVSTIVLLGLTWVFGFGVMEDHGSATLTFKYCFTILNSFQGFFIFLLQLMMDSTIKDIWHKKKVIGINPADVKKSSTGEIDLSDVDTKFRKTRRHM